MSAINQNYQKALQLPLSNRIVLAQKSYQAMKTEFNNAYGSWEGYNYALDSAIAIMACNGDITQQEYQLFVQITGSSPSYNDIVNNARKISQQYDRLIRIITSKGDELKVKVAYYYCVFCACKNSLNDYEYSFIEKALGIY